MDNNTVGMFTTTLVVLLSGLSGFFIPFAGAYSALMHNMPNAMLTVTSITSGANVALASGCCICIPIPLAFGALALHRRTNASALKETLSHEG